MKITKKTQIGQIIKDLWGVGVPLRYTDLQIAALMANGRIQTPAEFNRETDRGFYCSVLDGASYLFKWSSSPFRLVKSKTATGGYEYFLEEKS
jgi:hypothetical protein